MSRELKLVGIAWFVNLILFTVSLFLWSYYDHVDHWSVDAWRAIYSTSALTKVALSFIGVALFTNGGLNKKD